MPATRMNVVAKATPYQTFESRMKKHDPADSLEWTGERLVTSCERPLVFEHLHRYAIAYGLASRKRVLDIACGEGYGANLLAGVAAKVTGVDFDRRAIEHARSKYPHRNLEFIEGSCTEIPCADHSIELVASFETIEHLADHAQFLSELKRVMTPGAILVISSPDKIEYRRASGMANPYHAAELAHEEFVALMKKSFKHCVAGRQRLVVGSWVAPDAASPKVAAATFHGGFRGIEIEPGVHRGIYSIAICSNRPLPTVNLGMFEDTEVTSQTWHLLDRPEMPGELAAQTADAAQLRESFEEKATHVAMLQAEVEEKTRQIAELRQAFDEKVKHIGILQEEVQHNARQATASSAAFDEKVRHIAVLQREIEEKSRQVAHFTESFEEKVRHVGILQRELDEKTAQVIHFKDEAERQSRGLERAQAQLQLATDRAAAQLQVAEERLTRVSNELLEARWEALTLRTNALNASDSIEDTAPKLLELETRAQTAESERDNLREMLKGVQGDLEQEHAARELKEAELKAAKKELKFLHKQMARLREIISRRLVLPFGRAQRKIDQLTAATSADD